MSLVRRCLGDRSGSDYPITDIRLSPNWSSQKPQSDLIREFGGQHEMARYIISSVNTGQSSFSSVIMGQCSLSKVNTGQWSFSSVPVNTGQSSFSCFSKYGSVIIQFTSRKYGSVIVQFSSSFLPSRETTVASETSN